MKVQKNSTSDTEMAGRNVLCWKTEKGIVPKLLVQNFGQAIP
jgi:hypothetical protein